MKARILMQLALTAMLAAYGWMLVNAAPSHSESEHVKAAVDGNKRLLFVEGKGIDVQGAPVDPTTVPDARQVVAFVVRSRTLSEDVKFWSDVASLIPEGSGTILIGYCDGAECAESLRRQTPLSFPVIAYGEMIDAQAVLNADVDGLLLKRGLRAGGVLERIEWRNARISARELVGKLGAS